MDEAYCRYVLKYKIKRKKESRHYNKSIAFLIATNQRSIQNPCKQISNKNCQYDSQKIWKHIIPYTDSKHKKIRRQKTIHIYPSNIPLQNEIRSQYDSNVKQKSRRRQNVSGYKHDP